MFNALKILLLYFVLFLYTNYVFCSFHLPEFSTVDALCFVSLNVSLVVFWIDSDQIIWTAGCSMARFGSSQLLTADLGRANLDFIFRPFNAGQY
jgi:hypothetical protein